MPRRLYDEAVKEKDRRYRSQAGLPPPAAPVKIKITGDAQAAAERLRASGITVRFMPEVEKEIPEINKRLRAVLDKLGLKDIRLNIVNSLKAPGYVIYGRDGKPAAMFLKVPPGSPEYAKTMATIAQARAQGLRVEEDVFSANGSYAAKLIEIALDSKNPIRAARHEAIHALKELGFFTPQQWAVLERKAKSEWLKKYNIEGSGYGSLSKEGQIEEAIADAFSDFDQETPPTGQIGILFNKVKKFFEALGNAFRGSGFQTSSDVFTLVEEGRLTGPGATGVTGTEATRYSVAPLSKGEVDALSASGPNSALIIDAYNRWAQAFSKLPSDVKNKLDALYVANRKTKLTAQDPGYSDRGARAAETRTFKAASQALEKHLGKELNPDELSLYLTDWRGSVDERLEKPPSFERNKYSLSQIPRVMSTGKIVGAPPGKNTEADRELLINEMVQLLEDPFTMFNKSRFWYENSGKTIREMTRSDPELMERVVRLLSLYSQANSLGGNTTATIKSISQLAQGAPTALAGRFPKRDRQANSCHPFSANHGLHPSGRGRQVDELLSQPAGCNVPRRHLFGCVYRGSLDDASVRLSPCGRPRDWRCDRGLEHAIRLRKRFAQKDCRYRVRKDRRSHPSPTDSSRTVDLRQKQDGVRLIAPGEAGNLRAKER
jgi:hypothetical protein